MRVILLSLTLLTSALAFAPVLKPQRVVSSSLKAASMDLAPPPMSPLTKWGDKISDIQKLQEEVKARPAPEFAPEVSAKDLGLTTVEAQLQYVKDNAQQLKQKMQDCSAVVFRDFELMKTQEGFQDFYNALGMKVCLDPLHSVSARPTVDGKQNSPVYEAVNKESRKNFFIGKRRGNSSTG